ncbi:MAG: TetR/AcrR family transcriptional regulator [Gemmatimonadota bacterium]|nr:MAG: TetR/AcrR family transcriptional regulator [Gemmatimonadota bacterium]
MAGRENAGSRSGDVERAILEAARDLLAEKGLQGLSMRTVAERVGVSATAIYHYFENKEELVERVVQQGFLRFGEYIEQAMRAHSRGSLERVRAVGEAYLQFALENHAYFRVLFNLQRPHPHAIEDLPEGGGYGLLRQAVVDAMDSGAMRTVDPDLMVMYLWSLTHGLLMISLACQLEHCPEFRATPEARTPLEMFHAFGPLVREGVLGAAAATAGAAASDRAAGEE